MATFTEQRVLKQVQILPQSNTIQVQWADQVLKDGVVISETLHRCAYMQEQKDQFLAEVDNGAVYVATLGW